MLAGHRRRSWRRWAPRSPSSRRPSFGSTRRTCFCCTTATRPGSRRRSVPATSCSPAAYRVRVITLPDGEDPGYLRRKGRAPRASSARRRRRSTCSNERSRFSNEAVGSRTCAASARRSTNCCRRFVLTTDRAAARHLYISRTSEIAGVTREMLERELQTAPRRAASPRRNRATYPQMSRFRRRRSERRSPIIARYGACAPSVNSCACCCINVASSETAAERIGPDMFVDGAYGRSFPSSTAHDEDAPIDEIAAALDEDATQVLQELFDENGRSGPRRRRSIDASINALLSREIADRMTRDRPSAAVRADRKGRTSSFARRRGWPARCRRSGVRGGRVSIPVDPELLSLDRRARASRRCRAVGRARR